MFYLLVIKRSFFSRACGGLHILFSRILSMRLSPLNLNKNEMVFKLRKGGGRATIWGLGPEVPNAKDYSS